MLGFRAARKRAGLTQMEVAERFGVDHTTVLGWERGKWLPKSTRLMELAKLYGCTVDFLLTGNGGEADG